MTRKKDSITIFAPQDITEDEIREIRSIYKQDPLYNQYKLNILISGCDNLQSILGNVLIEKIRNLR